MGYAALEITLILIESVPENADGVVSPLRLLHSNDKGPAESSLRQTSLIAPTLNIMEDSTPPSITPQRDTPDGVWTHGPVQLARGRAAKDPNAQTTTYNVSSLDDFEASLREYLANPPDQPEHSECQLSFWIGASFMVSLAAGQSVPQPPPQLQAPQGYLPVAGLDTHYASTSNASGHLQHAQHIANPVTALALPSLPGQKASMSILEALAPTPDPKEKMKKQRAIAKTCVDSIQRVDGYRYSFHNCWNSREDDSFRFSYYCNDSLLNKDRAANGKGAKYGGFLLPVPMEWL